MTVKSNPKLVQLDVGWSLNSKRVAARFRDWRTREPSLARFKDTSALVRFMRGPAPAAVKNEVLHALLVWAREDPLGARLALEVMRPGVLNLTARLSRTARDPEERRAAVLAAVWEGIRRYPLEQRPRRIAANLLLDALHRTLVEAGTETAWQAVRSHAAPEPRCAAGEIDTDVDALLERAVRASALTVEEAELVLRSRIDDAQLVDLADELGVSYNTLKLRRQRAERRLLMFLGFRPVPRGRQKRPSSVARVAGAGPTGPDG